MVDAGDHHIVLEREQTRDGEVDAIGGRPTDKKGGGTDFGDPQRHLQSERIARAAVVALRSDGGELREPLQRPTQGEDARGAVAVVVADKDLHGAPQYTEYGDPGTVRTPQPGARDHAQADR